MCTACEWAPHFAAFGRTSRTHLTRRTLLTAAAVGVAVTAASACSVQPGSDAPQTPGGDDPKRADFVFRNGPIYTVSTAAPWAEAVAVTGNAISYVGDEAGAMALAGPDTTVIDLAGRLLMPGFVEGHIHPFLGAFLTTGVDLQVPTGADALAAIAQSAKGSPDGPVRAFACRVEFFGPDEPARPDLQ